MTLIHCPTCNTYLVEPDKNNRLDCLKCEDNFAFEDAKIGYANYTQIVEKLLEHHPEQLKKIIRELGLEMKKDEDREVKQQSKRDFIDAVMEKVRRENEQLYGIDDCERLVKVK